MMDAWTREFLLENLDYIMIDPILSDLWFWGQEAKLYELYNTPNDDWIAYEESEYDCDDPDDYMSEADE